MIKCLSKSKSINKTDLAARITSGKPGVPTSTTKNYLIKQQVAQTTPKTSSKTPTNSHLSSKEAINSIK